MMHRFRFLSFLLLIAAIAGFAACSEKGAAPSAYVVVRDGDSGAGEVLGRLVRTLDEGYEIEAQDVAVVAKEGVSIEFWSASDGKGVVCLKAPGTAPVYSAPGAESTVIGTAVYEEGYCPECYECLGYTRGWFRISLEGKEGYISEDVAVWDFVDRN